MYPLMHCVIKAQSKVSLAIDQIRVHKTVKSSSERNSNFSNLPHISGIYTSYFALNLLFYCRFKVEQELDALQERK